MNNSDLQFHSILKNHFQKIIKSFYCYIWIDIKSLPKWIWYLLFFTLIVSTFFSFFNFQKLTFQFPNFLLSLADDKQKLKLLIMKVLYILQIIFTLISIFNLILISFGKQSGWFWGSLGYLFFGLSAIPFGYGSVAMASIFFIVWLQFFGSLWWSAKKIKYPHYSMVIAKLKFRYLIIYLLLFAGLFILFYEIVPYFTYYVCHNKYHYLIDKKIGIKKWNHKWAIQIPRSLDALSGAGNIVNVLATIFIFKINWILWCLLDCCQVALFFKLNGNGINYNYFVLYLIFILYSLYGTYIWYFKNDFYLETILF